MTGTVVLLLLGARSKGRLHHLGRNEHINSASENIVVVVDKRNLSLVVDSVR